MNQDETILLIEDDHDILSTIKELLEFEKYKVIAAPSTEVALKLLERIRPTVILADVLLNGTTCEPVVEYVQKKHPSIPVILTSASGAMVERVSNKYGIPYILKKPFSLEEFFDMLTKVTGKKSS